MEIEVLLKSNFSEPEIKVNQIDGTKAITFTYSGGRREWSGGLLRYEWVKGEGYEEVPVDVTRIEVASTITIWDHFCHCMDGISIEVIKEITTIGDGAFYRCVALRHALIPDTVTSLGNCVFWKCSSLATITLPSNMAYLGDHVFWECSSLTTITLPSNMTYFGHCVFSGCSSLAAITLPSTMTSLGNCVFSRCSSLKMITLPSRIKHIGDRVFQGCSSLTKIMLPTNMTSLGDYVFQGCSSLSKISLPTNIISLGHGVFSGCSSLTTVTVPSVMLFPDHSVFHKCSLFVSLPISSNMSSLGDRVFDGCSSLTLVTLPSMITSSLGSCIFSNCPLLTTVTLPEYLKTISTEMFQECPEKLTTIKHSSFTTTTFGKSPGDFKVLLVKAGFSLNKLDTILYSHPDSSSSVSDHNPHSNLYHDMKTWGRTKVGNSHRIPLCIAAARDLKWVNMKQILAVNIPAVYEVDELTGLPVFMLAAVGPTSILESVYRLLKEYPPAVHLMNNRQQNSLDDTMYTAKSFNC